MAERNFIHISKLKGKTVLISETGERVGEISDAIVHPTEGRMLGIEIRNAKNQYAVLNADQFVIGPDAVMAKTNVPFGMERDSLGLDGGVRAIANLEGSNVVTEDGRLLGRISDSLVEPGAQRVFYYIAESSIKRFLGRGYYLPASCARAYSHEGERLIVPADTEERFAASSLDETNIDQPTRA